MKTICLLSVLLMSFLNTIATTQITLPSFVIESEERRGDTINFVLRAKEYELNNEKLSILVTGTANTKKPCSITLILKGCGRGIFFGATIESMEKNHTELIKILHQYRCDIEKDILEKSKLLITKT